MNLFNKMKNKIYQLIATVLFLMVLAFGASVFFGLLIIIPFVVLSCMFSPNPNGKNESI